MFFNLVYPWEGNRKVFYPGKDIVKILLAKYISKTIKIINEKIVKIFLDLLVLKINLNKIPQKAIPINIGNICIRMYKIT